MQYIQDLRKIKHDKTIILEARDLAKRKIENFQHVYS